MPDWEERITRESQPTLRLEHDLRYRLAVPLVAAADTWCDLGCGNGVAAASAAGGAFAGRPVLVDADADAVGAARRALGGAEEDAIVGDLTDAGDLARIREALLRTEGQRVITCFEVVEHLDTFIPLVQMLSELAEAGRATVLLSVPNDAFWALENPHHRTMWGEGAFAELERLLPAGHVQARQVELHGSAVLLGDEPARHDVPVALEPAGVPTHFIAAFGPRAGEIAGGAGVVQTDLEGRRAWERQREANLAYGEAELHHLRELVRANTRQFEEWRVYIHDLEGRLGLPQSGSEAAMAAEAPGAGSAS